MQGRKRKPTALKALQGTLRKDRTNVNEPKVELKIPVMPDFLYGEGKKEWKRITKELFDLGLVSEMDRAALTAYCQCYHHWVEAEKEIIKEGLIVHTTDSQGQTQLKPNPFLKVASSSLSQMKGFLTEFGMTPSSRSRISISKPEETGNPFDYI